MKKTYILSLAFAAACAALTGCSSDPHAGHNHGHEGHNHAAEGHEGHNHGAPEAESEEHEEGIIMVTAEQAKLFGVATTPVRLASFDQVVKVPGTVVLSAENNGVVTAPVSGVVTLARGITAGASVSGGATVATVKTGTVSGTGTNEVARAELAAARAELDRLTPLYEQRLVTQARYNEARAAYERARAAYSSAASSGRATAPTSGVITSIEAGTGQYVEAGAPIAVIAGQGSMTIRADVPARFARDAAAARDARIVVPSTGETFTVSEIGGKRIGASATAAVGGYLPVTFSLPAGKAALVTGEGVEVYLITGTTAEKQLVIPRSALYEQQGDYCVFVKVHDNEYRKTPVTVGATDGLNVAVTSGLAAGEQVVSSGVTTVRLAGASGAVPHGHSH